MNPHFSKLNHMIHREGPGLKFFQYELLCNNSPVSDYSFLLPAKTQQSCPHPFFWDQAVSNNINPPLCPLSWTWPTSTEACDKICICHMEVPSLAGGPIAQISVQRVGKNFMWCLHLLGMVSQRKQKLAVVSLIPLEEPLKILQLFFLISVHWYFYEPITFSSPSICPTMVSNYTYPKCRQDLPLLGFALSMTLFLSQRHMHTYPHTSCYVCFKQFNI
jgi:hypothetical protein